VIEPVVGDDFEQTNGVGAQVGDCVVGQRTLVGQGPGRPCCRLGRRLGCGLASGLGVGHRAEGTGPVREEHTRLT
jgi:hypothetical protein